MEGRRFDADCWPVAVGRREDIGPTRPKGSRVLRSARGHGKDAVHGLRGRARVDRGRTDRGRVDRDGEGGRGRHTTRRTGAGARRLGSTGPRCRNVEVALQHSPDRKFTYRDTFDANQSINRSSIGVQLQAAMRRARTSLPSACSAPSHRPRASWTSYVNMWARPCSTVLSSHNTLGMIPKMAPGRLSTGALLPPRTHFPQTPNAHTRWPGAWRVEGVTGSTNRHLVYVGLEIVEMGPHGPVENKLFLVLFMLFMQ